MRRRLMCYAVIPVLAGGAFLAPSVLTGAHAEEPPPIDCAAWYEHPLALTDQIPPFAEARAAGTEEARADARRLYIADCETVIATPAAHAEEMELLHCTLGAEDAEAWMACVDSTPSEAERVETEASARLSGIRTAERAYQAEWDTYTACPPTPPEIPGVERVPFEGGGLRNFENLGWVPDGPVQCRYSVETSDDGFEFEARVECDQDGDGEISVWKATAHTRPERVTAEGVR